MANQRDIVVVGGANFDYLVRGAALPRPGETVEGHTFQAGPGGKGANQAVAAARLGATVSLIARIGTDDRGDQLLSRLNAEGVETSHVSRDSEAPTGVALIMVDGQGEKQIFTAPGANRRLSVEDIRAAADSIASARIVLLQLEVPLDVVTAAVRMAREAGASVILDPAPPAPLSDDLLSLIDVIRPNSREAEAMTEVRVTDRASARRAAHKLLERGVGAAVVQKGEEGDLLVTIDDERWLPRIPVQTIDATGAGDAFAGALAVSISEGRSIADAAQMANAASALATTKLGAQDGLPSRDEVFALLRRFGINGHN